MRRFSGRFGGALLTLLAGAATADGLDDPLVVEAFVDGVVMPLMAQNNSPSGTVVIAKDGEVILAKGYGYEDIGEQEPVDPDRTLFRPGSVSKLFTWVSVMQLVEQGRLDLDADVNTYLETFEIRDTFEEPITLRHIMTHTTGFEDGALGYLIIEDVEKAIPLRDAMERYQPERVNPPGAQTAYSNYATALAGLIVQNVSGQPFAEYVRRNIFEPLGMHNSSFAEPLPEGLESHMATSYAVEAGTFVEKPFEIISNFAPAGAQSATATDMVRFGRAILNGGELDGTRILEQATVEQMLTRAYSHDDRMMGMALGFYEEDYNDHRVVGHGGDTRWFHSFLGIDRESDLTFFVSFGAPGGGTVRTAFANALYDEFYPRVEAPPVPPEDFSERAGRYAGSYGFWRSNFTRIDKFLSLTGATRVAPTGDDTLVVSLGGKAKQYAEVGDNLFRELDPGISLISGISPRLMAFQEDESGDVTGFVLDGLPFMSLRRLPAYATSGFNFALLGFASLVLLGVVLRRFFQRVAIRALPDAERSAINAAFSTAAFHLFTLVSGFIVLTLVMDRLFIEIPLLLKAWLILPIVATLAALYLAYRTWGVWAQRALTGLWARLRYTVVAFSALGLTWFYYYWNILGFQYF